MARRDEETQLQIAVADFLRLALPPEVIWTAINPRPGLASKKTAGLRKAMGLRAGVLDLGFWWPVRQCGLIEIKTDDGRASPAQLDFAERLRAARIPYDFCRSVEAVERALRSWGIQLRASVGGPNVGSHLPKLSAHVLNETIRKPWP